MTNKLAFKIALPMVFAAFVLLAIALVLMLPPVQLLVKDFAEPNLVVFTGMMLCVLFCLLSIRSAFNNLRRLKQVVADAKRLAVGDFSFELAARKKDEIGELEAALNHTVSYLRQAASAANQIAAGNLLVSPTPRSENDHFATALKNMLDSLREGAQTKSERDRLQFSIMKLLEEVSDVADGDLTVEAEVTAEATGAIADAFNYMISELRSIVSRVQAATAEVGNTAVEIRATTERLSEGSEMQAEQIAATSTAMEKIAASIQQVSLAATESLEVSNNALENARYGAKAVGNNIEAMNRVRSQVQETAKRIKRLGERSQEIDEIVRLIDDLADRTSILALNASLQAAAAGEQGRGFANVAEEVERLSERSAEALSNIAALTKSIQNETREAVAAMEETIQEVVQGSQMANEAGATLQEIERVSVHLADLIDDITQTAVKQAESSKEISSAMTRIASITELVSAESHTNAGSVRGLINSTERLRSSVSSFKLNRTKENADQKLLPENAKNLVPAVSANGNGHFVN
jgi:twitching motility protein PilJ